jgi:hypothetical protein
MNREIVLYRPHGPASAFMPRTRGGPPGATERRPAQIRLPPSPFPALAPGPEDPPLLTMALEAIVGAACALLGTDIVRQMFTDARRRIGPSTEPDWFNIFEVAMKTVNSARSAAGAASAPGGPTGQNGGDPPDGKLRVAQEDLPKVRAGIDAWINPPGKKKISLRTLGPRIGSSGGTLIRLMKGDPVRAPFAIGALRKLDLFGKVRLVAAEATSPKDRQTADVATMISDLTDLSKPPPDTGQLVQFMKYQEEIGQPGGLEGLIKYSIDKQVELQKERESNRHHEECKRIASEMRAEMFRAYIDNVRQGNPDELIRMKDTMLSLCFGPAALEMLSNVE